MFERYASPRLSPPASADWALRCAYALMFVTVLACATDDGACTEVDCSNRTTVTYGQSVGSEAYTLQLSADGETATFSCNGPDAAQNPDGVTCDANGFELEGHPLADRRSLFVTVTSEDAADPVIDGVEVTLGTVDTLIPNGAGCEPTCYVRSGSVIL